MSGASRSWAPDPACHRRYAPIRPRASTLGGCAGHHAMITVYPGDGDWDRIAVLVDASVFPRIPGLFILASAYRVSEKASDVILAEYA